MENNEPTFNEKPVKNDNSKNILIVCNIVLLIAVVLLYIFHFAGIGTRSRTNPDAKPAVVAEGGALKVAYINVDTLNARYEYIKDLEKELNAYKTSKENSLKAQTQKLQSDVQALQNEYQNYLKTGDQLTLSQQQAKEADLKKREAELNQRAEKLASLEQEYTKQIMEKHTSENQKMLNAVYAFIREYNADNQQFNLILARTGSELPLILYGDEAMDITEEIVAGLNEEYKTVKKNREAEKK